MAVNATSHFFCIFVCSFAIVSFTTFDATSAEITHDIDFFVIGDDNSITILFENEMLSNESMQLWFDGFAENLEAIENNGILASLRVGEQFINRTRYFTPPTDPNTGIVVQVPVHLHALLDNSPPQIGFDVEGLGPNDNIHVKGTLTLTNQVPEPSGWLLAIVYVWALFDPMRRGSLP